MKTTFRYLRPLAPIASFAFFVYVLERSGPAAVFDKIRLLGWGFALLVLLSGGASANWMWPIAGQHCARIAAGSSPIIAAW